MLEIRFRPAAEADLRAIVAYTRQHHGTAQARHYVEEIRRQITFAAEYPGIGSAVHGLPETYRKLRTGAHRVIYRCTTQHLIVVRIVHEREDVPDELDD